MNHDNRSPLLPVRHPQQDFFVCDIFDGRMLDVEMKLSDGVFNAIRANEVLTINRDYFRLRKPLERRIYEMARKHCGAQQSWKIGLEKLHKKTGSSSTGKEFRRLVRNIIRQDELHHHMPDYSIRMDASDILEFVNRRTDRAGKAGQGQLTFDATPSSLQLKPDTFTDARAAAPGWDVYYLETKWRSWTTELPRNPDAAFIGFCRQWLEKCGRP
jgi:hypothetical protein